MKNYISVTKSGSYITFSDGTDSLVLKDTVLQVAKYRSEDGYVYIDYMVNSKPDEIKLVASNVTAPINTGGDNLVALLITMAGLPPNTGNATITNGKPVNAVANVRTLTVTSGTPTDGKTVKVGGKTYTFKTTLTPTEGEVLINGSLANALTNLKAAINHTGAPDTDYKCAAANVNETTGTLTGTTLQTTYNVAGIIGYNDTPTTNVTNGSWANNTVGVNGTVGDITTIYEDATYMYTTLGNTIAQANWVRVSRGSTY